MSILKDRKPIKKPLFVDLDLSFTRNPINGDVSVLKDSDAIKQSIKLLVMMDMTEVPYHTEIGGNIYRILGEMMSVATAGSIRERITKIIIDNEPRARLLDVEVLPDFDSKSYLVRVVFGINTATTDTVEELVFPLERIR